MQLCQELDGLPETNLDVPDGGYQGAYLHDYARLVRDREGDRLAQLAPADAMASLRAIGREIVVFDIEDELATMGVSFDRWFSEKSLYDEGLVDKILEATVRKGRGRRPGRRPMVSGQPLPGQRKGRSGRAVQRRTYLLRQRHRLPL